MDRAITYEKKGSRPNSQHDGWPIHEFVPSFSPKTAIKAVGVKSPSIDGRLLDLSSSYLRHVISMFNTCSREPTHRSLADTGGGYNLGGAGFPHHTLWPFQPMVLGFPIKGPTGSQVIQHQHKPLVRVMWSIYRRLVVFRPLGIYRSLYLCLVMANILQY
jgi:hypothetical protein